MKIDELLRKKRKLYWLTIFLHIVSILLLSSSFLTMNMSLDLFFGISSFIMIVCSFGELFFKTQMSEMIVIKKNIDNLENVRGYVSDGGSKIPKWNLNKKGDKSYEKIEMTVRLFLIGMTIITLIVSVYLSIVKMHSFWIIPAIVSPVIIMDIAIDAFIYLKYLYMAYEKQYWKCKGYFIEKPTARCGFAHLYSWKESLNEKEYNGLDQDGIDLTRLERTVPNDIVYEKSKRMTLMLQTMYGIFLFALVMILVTFYIGVNYWNIFSSVDIGKFSLSKFLIAGFIILNLIWIVFLKFINEFIDLFTEYRFCSFFKNSDENLKLLIEPQYDGDSIIKKMNRIGNDKLSISRGLFNYTFGCLVYMRYDFACGYSRLMTIENIPLSSRLSYKYHTSESGKKKAELFTFLFGLMAMSLSLLYMRYIAVAFVIGVTIVLMILLKKTDLYYQTVLKWKIKIARSIIDKYGRKYH